MTIEKIWGHNWLLLTGWGLGFKPISSTALIPRFGLLLDCALVSGFVMVFVLVSIFSRTIKKR
ncbi:MAG: hypothetical protein QW478_06440 [Candidatus Micrarchaeaceae archaeon]